MQNQTSVLELEETIQSNNPNNLNIDNCIENLKNTIKNIENTIKAIKETWFFGRLTDNTIKQQKGTLLNLLKELIDSNRVNDDCNLLKLRGQLELFIKTLAYHSVNPKFSVLSSHTNALTDYMVEIEIYVNSLKNLNAAKLSNQKHQIEQLTNQHQKLEKENQTLLNAIDKNPQKQMVIKSLINTAEAMQVNNLQLSETVDIFKEALNTTMKENEELKTKVIQKNLALDKTTQKLHQVQKDNQQLKQNKILHKEKEKQSAIKTKNQALENSKLKKESKQLKQKERIQTKKITGQKSAYNSLEYKYQDIKTNFVDLKNKLIEISSISDKKTVKYLTEKNKLIQRIRELEQAQSNDNRSTHRDAHPSYNPNQLFPSAIRRNNIDYNDIGTANDMQQTLYGQNNY